MHGGEKKISSGLPPNAYYLFALIFPVLELLSGKNWNNNETLYFATLLLLTNIC